MITFHGVIKTFGGTPAVADFSLRIEDGAFCVLIGPSGCGKSTVLRMINAMVEPDRGELEVFDTDIRRLDPVQLRRKIGYVIQSVGLFPHWTIAQNIAAVPRLLGWTPARCKERVEAMAALLHIDPALLERYPDQLSGGQQQRVGVARALAADPDIVLMDEPFAALDPVGRALLQDEILRIHQESGKTIVFVTHDMDEALRLATLLVVMNRGRVVQVGTPADILSNPADAFVRDFLGGENLRIRLLDLIRVRDRSTRRKGGAANTIGSDASLKEALTMMLTHRVTRLSVQDEGGIKKGEIDITDIVIGRDAR